MRNPFMNNKSQEQILMSQQNDYTLNQEMVGSATHPQNFAEEESFREQQNLMAELTRWQQDLSPMLKELFLNLAGLMEDEEAILKKDPMNIPVCSIYCAKRWINHIKPLNMNVMNGAWSIKQINDAMIWLDGTIRQDIIEHHRKYDIEYSVATFTYICNTIINAVYPTFLRGLDNGERKFHGQIQKVIETKNILPDKKKGGLFSKD